jgi:PhoH-like ATPase
VSKKIKIVLDNFCKNNLKQNTMTTKKRKEKKVFVLDTNVILHDPKSIKSFQEHDLVIPITVIEELDKFKKGSEENNLHARMFLRDFDELTMNPAVFNGGASLGDGLGKISVKLCSKINNQVKIALSEDTKDHRILSIVCDLIDTEKEKEETKRKVILVSKDNNLRIKARSLSIEAQDYENDKVANFDELYTGTDTIITSSDLINKVYSEESIFLQELRLKKHVYPNQYFILKTKDGKAKDGKANAIVQVDSNKEKLIRIEKKTISGILPKNSEQTFSMNALMNPELSLVTLSGTAGTGKTLLALAAAIEQLNQGLYNIIYLARPIVELSNKTLGFLPGDADEKISPYMQPLFDNLAVIKNSNKKTKEFVEKIEKEEKKFNIIPLAFVRGRSLNKCFWIIDEAQNLTPHEVKTIITRAGEGTKIVLTGDPQQIDHPYLDSRSNGLSYTIEKWKGQPTFGHVTLVKGERSPLAELASQIM